MSPSNVHAPDRRGGQRTDTESGTHPFQDTLSQLLGCRLIECSFQRGPAPLLCNIAGFNCIFISFPSNYRKFVCKFYKAEEKEHGKKAYLQLARII